MSRNIVIQEGGVVKTIVKVAKIRTAASGGGYYYWVPEEEVALMPSKNITKDGTYRASDDGYYGYAEVVVSGVGTTLMGDVVEKDITENGTYTASSEGHYGYSVVRVNVSSDKNTVTGTDTDDNEYAITTDDDGNLVKLPLPSYIDVTTVPYKGTSSNPYTFGAQMDYTGIVVKAYTASKVLWDNSDEGYPGGVIPFEELIFPQKYAGNQLADNLNGAKYVYLKLVSNDDDTETFGIFTEITEDSKSIMNFTMFDSTALSGEQTESVPVRWARPKDGRILSTTFDIAVTDFAVEGWMTQ